MPLCVLSVVRFACPKPLCPGVAPVVCILEAGDALYIPQGYWHQVQRIEGHEK